MASPDGTAPNKVPASWKVGEDIDWTAPWCKVYLRTELPFWMMVGPADLSVEVCDQMFPVSVSDHFFEYSYDQVSDSKHTVFLRGSRKTQAELAPLVDAIRTRRPGAQIVERKCKTIVRITTRCNADVGEKIYKAGMGRAPASTRLYLEELCRGHLPVLNRVIQAYRLATYDYFAFEVSSWDVPNWYVDFKNGCEATAVLTPYKGWDHKPLLKKLGSDKFDVFSLLDPESLSSSLRLKPGDGELELLDSINLFERGDYCGAVRRGVTALEVVAEASLRLLMTGAVGADKATSYLKETETNFEKRVGRLCGLSGRNFPFWRRLRQVRDLRHQIVHEGLRIDSAGKGQGQMAVDLCRWMYNWFENDRQKMEVRENRIALRSMGRDVSAGVFSPVIMAEGINLSPIPD